MKDLNILYMKAIRLFVFVLLMGSSLAAQAWWDAGHMLTAQIAYERLSGPARNQADALIMRLMQEYPYTNNFVAASAWPDDLKAEGVHLYDHWHYTNIPYNPDGLALPESAPQNVVWAINNCKSILQRESAKDLEKGRALAFLIHFIGDIHQPLHCGSMYSNEMPGGDQGGNKYMVEEAHGGLHKLWDDGCGLTSELNDIRPYGQPKEPISEANMKRIAKFARQITKAWPAKSFDELELHDPDFWALESHKLAVKYAYHGRNGMTEGKQQFLEPGGKPGTEYIEKGREIVAKRIALGGYRLAQTLNFIWK